MRFRAVLEAHGKTATGIEVPPGVVAGLGSSKRPAVRVRLGSHEYRSTVASMGGRYLLPVSAEHRAAAGLTAGDEVDVVLDIDDAPRTVTVPADLAAALAEDEQARGFFDGLSYSKQSWFVLSVEQAKKPETRQRRVEKAVAMLGEGRTGS